MGLFTSRGTEMVTAERALPGREEPMLISAPHLVLGTKITPPAEEFYYAEPSHQQYLEANPGGYCGLGGTGVACPVGLPGASTE
jgi:peptide-methionine (S)-S-oxide reductase